NWTLGPEGITRGWIETVVPAPTRTFLVVLRREDRRSASEVPAPAIGIFSYYQSAGGKTTPPVTPHLRHLTFEGDSAYLFYDAPGGPAQGDRLHVVVTPGAGWRQEGLISYSVDVSILLEGARTRPLVPLAVYAPGTGKLQTKVILR
ncbi:MAG: hypothetical protein M3328_17750, partial [Chloroflexota bacterium]|nr:hypothetical protein [Chloroflexota bacterium]